VFVGIETPDNDILRVAQKRLNVNKDIVETVKKINKYGMIVNGGFIVGFDNESDRSAGHMIKCIQDSGICMAMVGKLYALPNTQLTRRLKKEKRLFEDDSILRDVNTDVDQTTSGLNFLTVRPRVDILKDYVRILETTYNANNYYERIISTCLNLRPANKFKPGFAKILKSVKILIVLSRKVGFNKTTGWLYWKMLSTIIIKNPGATEAAINLAAMYIHFHKHSRFVIELTKKEIESLEKIGGDVINKVFDRELSVQNR
jgi:hypothetical protein